MRILMIGDIVGSPGRNCVRDLLPQIKANYEIDFVVANGENSAGGHGLTRKTAEELFSYHVDVLTMGNHVWDKKEIFNFIDNEKRVIRPANYPPQTPGRGLGLFNKNGVKIGVINISGDVFMENLDCPFRTADFSIKGLGDQPDIIIVDFHAEATSEKIAMGYYLDGRVSAIFGTHTHVQTADERILEKGACYITDVGMTGPYDSVLGMNYEPIINKFVTKLPGKFEVAKGDRVQFNAVIAEIEELSGNAKSIERLQEIHDF